MNDNISIRRHSICAFKQGNCVQTCIAYQNGNCIQLDAIVRIADALTNIAIALQPIPDRLDGIQASIDSIDNLSIITKEDKDYGYNKKKK